MSNFEIAISVFLVLFWLVMFFSGAFKGEYNPMESGWENNEKLRHFPSIHKSENENDFDNFQVVHIVEESETPMQKFRRENTMSECVRRGGYLTTGERMEAMYGTCEEAAMCFPDEYYHTEEQ